MAVNLENLLPQAMRDPSPFTVPSDGCEDLSAFADLLSPSMYSPGDFSSLLGGVADVSAFEPSQKGGFPSPNGGVITGEFGVGDALYQTEAPGDILSDWMTTPMSLPLTPEEPTSGTASPVPPTSCFPAPAPVPTYSSHTPLTPDSVVSPPSSAVPTYAGHASSGHTPLTPVSPQSSCGNGNGEELDDVLSYFADSTPDMATGSGQDFSTFSADVAANNYTNIYCDSPHSSYASLSSTPSSPSSTFTPATPTSHTPYMSATPSGHTPMASPHFHHAIAPNDTIRDLLARDSAQQWDDLCPTGQQVVESVSEPMSRTRGVKRKMCDDADEVIVLESSSSSPSPSKRPAKSSGGRRKLSTVVKKERKREQNKNAALRYRQKKKEEKLEIDQQQQELEERNSLLRTTLRNLEAEVSYLKKLWSEVASAKRERSQRILQ